MTDFIETDPLLRKAHDEALRAAALSHELWLHDQATREGIAYDKGWDEGVRKTARAMKQLGAEFSLIVDVTGLSEREVEGL